MLFQLYGSTAMTQLLGWVLVFAGLVILNEIGRRTKMGGIVIFVIIPAILTIYFIGIQAGLFGGHSNQTYEYMNGWFHYAKLYAADIGVVGFLMIKYKWGLGKKEWFKPWPFIIVAINILIAVASDLSQLSELTRLLEISQVHGGHLMKVYSFMVAGGISLMVLRDLSISSV